MPLHPGIREYYLKILFVIIYVPEPLQICFQSTSTYYYTQWGFPVSLSSDSLIFFFVLSNLFLNYLLSFSFIIVVFLAINFPSDSSLRHSFAETLLYDEVLFLNKFL